MIKNLFKSRDKVFGGVKIENIKNHCSLTIIKIFSWLIIIILICSGLLHSIFFYHGPNSVDAASAWTQTSDQDFHNGAFKNTTMIGSGDDTELIIIPNRHSWTKKIVNSAPESRRNSPLATIFNTDKVMLFGGYGKLFPPLYNNIRNDTWIYDLSNNTWTEMIQSTHPEPREKHGLASIYGDDKVLIYGGTNFQTSSYFNDTWIYDLSDNTWTKKTATNIPTSKRNFALSSIYGTDKVLLYGGTNGYNDTWIYDLSDDNWMRLYPPTNPGGRSSHAMAMIFGTDKVVLFGGSTSIADTWVYDLSENNWTKKTPTKKPGVRYWHAMASIHGTDKVVLYSGLSTNDNTWVYDLSQDEWTNVLLKNQTNTPGPRYAYGMTAINGTSKVVLYGYPVKHDTWLYEHDLSIRNGTYCSIPYDTGANSSFYKISWNANTPVFTDIKLQLRTGKSELDLNDSDFIGPDGTLETYYLTSQEEIWNGHDGDRWIQYKLFININKYSDPPIFNDIMISYNCLPITIVNSPTNGSLLMNNKPNFKWTFFDHDSDHQKTFQVTIDDNIDFTDIDFDSGEQNSSEQSWEFSVGTNYNILPDGSWYWRVRTCDEDDAWTKYSQPRLLIIDTNKPQSRINWPTNNGVYNSLNTIIGNSTDPNNGSGIMKVEIALRRLSDNQFWDGSHWIHLPTWLVANGTKEWRYDLKGILWNSGAKYSLRSRATDLATLIEATDNSIVFSMDMDRPSSSIDIPLDNRWINNLDIITGSSIDNGGAGIDFVEICIKCIKDHITWDEGAEENNYWDGINKKWNTAETWLTTTGTEQWSYNSTNVEWTTGNHYQISSLATDIVGNQDSVDQRITIKYDAEPPNELGIYINNGAEYSNTNEVNLSLQAEDIGSGISEMSFRTNETNWTPWELYNITRAIALVGDNGEKIVYFRLRDFAGNTAEQAFDTIILDTAPPEELSITINENAQFINQSIVTLTLVAKDIVSGLNDMAFSYDGFNWLAWVPFKTSRTFQLSPVDGEKRIFFKARDDAGNIADPVFDLIIFDKSPPSLLSIIINGGANITSSKEVLLELNAEDITSGVDKISFSLDNETWSEWEENARIKHLILQPGDGIKTIYFRAKDHAGNIADAVSASILLNTSIQELEIESPTKASSEDSLLLYYIIIIIIVIILLVAIWFFIETKYVKRFEQELLLSSGVRLKPSVLPGTTIIQDQIPATTAPAILPGPVQTPTITSQQLAGSTKEAPMLVKSTQTLSTGIQEGKQPEQEQTQTQPVSQPEVPQLPPHHASASDQPPVGSANDTISPSPSIGQAHEPVKVPTVQVVLPPDPQVQEQEPQKNDESDSN